MTRLRHVIAIALVSLAADFVAAPLSAATDPNGIGYAGKGQLVVRTSIGGTGTEVTLGGDIALEERGSFLRVDVLSLAIPGVDATISSLFSTQLFPPGGFTIVYDRSAGTYAVWSAAKHVYFTSARPANGETPALPPQAPTAAALGAVGDLFGAFAVARPLKNDSAFTASVSLAGHGVVNGHPATALDYHYARTTNGGEAIDIHGRLQLADDLDAVPVEVTASGKSNSFPQSSLRLDLTTLTKMAIAGADLHVPADFMRVGDVGDVIGKSLGR
ncbi:MAG: hypothetical protein IAI50_05190 [Candidatus Eremiobacteraeota bacterium]|nr:hypothetical protein [Candidatus Eremiobacteraeota bacterium]